MRKYSLIIASLLLTACTSSTPKPTVVEPNIAKKDIKKSDTKNMEALKTALSSYTEATVSNDIKSLVEFIYPKAFKIVSKEKMLSMLTKTLNAGNMPKVKDVKHTEIKPIKKYSEGVYSIITSSMTTVLKSPRPNDAKFEEYMLTKLQNQLVSKGTVTLDKENHLFNIKHTNKTIALNEDGSWKFIGFKQAKKYINKEIFPLELIDKLK